MDGVPSRCPAPPRFLALPCLKAQNVITIDDVLTYDDPISVTKSGGILTQNWSIHMDGATAENYFNCGSYELQKIEGELQLVSPSAHVDGNILFDKDLQSLTADNKGCYVVSTSANYYLSNNYTIGDSASIEPTLFIGDGTTGITVNLCLNGNELARARNDAVDSPVIIVRENATLNIYDCKGTGTVTGGTAVQPSKTAVAVHTPYGGGILVYGTLNLYGGSITGNSAEAEGVAGGFGGGVYVAPGGSFAMSGGSVTGNEAETSGGGVTVAGAGDAGAGVGANHGACYCWRRR